MAAPSSSRLGYLPDVPSLSRLLQSLATLDAIVCPEWEYRYYSFNAQWSDMEQMGSMRNGSGDEFFALFGPFGCFFKGLAHEYSAALFTSEMLHAVPSAFASGVNEPAFSMDHTTFCYWRSIADSHWSCISRLPDADGSANLLQHLDGNPHTYKLFADDYYDDEFDVPIHAIQHIYDHKPVSDQIVRSINPAMSVDYLHSDLNQIGYPV